MSKDSILNSSGIRTVDSFDGVSISCRVQGTDTPALVFVHGLACNRTHWDAQVAHFASTHTVVAIDLAGHGKSGVGRENWTIENFARDVSAVVEKLDLDNVVLAGHSMGGAVILEVEKILPDRVSALVGVDTFTYEQTYPKLPQEAIEQILTPIRANFPEAMRGLVHQLFSASKNPDPDLVEKVATEMATFPPDIMLPALEELLMWDLDDALKKQGTPLRCINSRNLSSKETNQRYADYFDVVLMPDVGHFVMMENPDLFNRLLAEAIRELVSP